MKKRNDNLHVAHIVRTLGADGGMERNLYRIVVALDERGIRNTIILLNDRSDIIDFGRYAPVHRVVAPEKDRTIILRIRDLLNDLRPDVVHARNWASWPDAALARMTCFPRPPLVFSFHGIESTAIPFKRKLAFQAMAKLTTRLFTVSNAAREFLIDSFGLGNQPIGVIHNGVDLETFKPPPWRENGGRLVVGGMGRLYYSNVKNFPLLIGAAARLVRAGVDVEVRIAGNGPDIVALTALAEELGMADRVRFVGHVENVAGFLAGLDLFVLSSDSEAMPNALLEAMAMGRPCVATAVGGVVEILAEGDAGIMVPPKDEAALADALMQLVGDPRRRRALGANARKRVETAFSTEVMFDRYERLYRETAR